MRVIIFFCCCFFSVCTIHAQITHHIIMDEMEILHGENIDTVMVFGNTCGDCNADVPSRLYFLFQEGKDFKCKVLKYIHSGTVSTLAYDSTYMLTSSNVIQKYLRDNYDSITNQFKHSFELLTLIKDVGNGKKRIIMPLDIGPYFHLGLYLRHEYYYFNISTVYDPNLLFEKAFESWVLFNFLKNQFPDVINDF